MKKEMAKMEEKKKDMKKMGKDKKVTAGKMKGKK